MIGVPGSELRVADTTIHCAQDQLLVFDDSFEHEAWHKGDATRLVLVFDVWHPDLSDKEVHFLSFLQRARMKASRKMEERLHAEAEAKAKAEGRELTKEETGDNFFQLLRDARDDLKDNSWWK